MGEVLILLLHNVWQRAPLTLQVQTLPCCHVPAAVQYIVRVIPAQLQSPQAAQLFGWMGSDDSSTLCILLQVASRSAS